MPRLSAQGIVKSPFGGETKAADGVIATLELDGHRFSRHFFQVVKSRGRYGGIASRAHWRIVIKDPVESATQQVIDYCDRTGAKIVCLSTPDTILRDLQGTRAALRPNSDKNTVAEGAPLPEFSMLRNRVDLLVGRES